MSVNVVDVLEMKDGVVDKFSTESMCTAGVTCVLFTVKKLLTLYSIHVASFKIKQWIFFNTLYLCVPYASPNKQRLLLHTTLTDWVFSL